ncbi:hypothetical protein BaRGS_00029093, partial [Batillaria attramentaria]
MILTASRGRQYSQGGVTQLPFLWRTTKDGCHFDLHYPGGAYRLHLTTKWMK